MTNGNRLFPEFEALDEGLVALDIPVTQVGQQAGASRNHFGQAPARMIVLGMGLEVLRHGGDAFRQQRHLDLRTSSVRRIGPVAFDQLLTAGGRHYHRNSFSLPSQAGLGIPYNLRAFTALGETILSPVPSGLSPGEPAAHFPQKRRAPCASFHTGATL